MTLGVWNSVERKLVRGENVRAALNFVARAEAPPWRRLFWIDHDSAASTGVVLASMSWP